MKREGSATMAIRILGLLAILDAAGAAMAAGLFAGLALNAPTVRLGVASWTRPEPLLRAVVGNLGITAIAVATGGLPFRFQDRISNQCRARRIIRIDGWPDQFDEGIRRPIPVGCRLVPARLGSGARSCSAPLAGVGASMLRGDAIVGPAAVAQGDRKET
jgi:hypothetical protein